MSTISTNMNLIVPTVGSTPGPDWASDLNSSLTLIDSHDHTPGKGVPITPSGLSINSDLTFNSNNATALRSSRYTPQVAPLALTADKGIVYVSGADLYYNDTAGNQIRLTIGGSPNSGGGSISGLPSGTASASYSTGTFTWQSATLTPAAMDQGPTTIREGIASGKGVTLVTTGALASNYSITLPLLPVSQKIMTLDASGNMTAPYTVDGSTIAISSNIIGVPNGGIGQVQLATGSVINSKLGPLAVQTANIDNLAVTTGKIANLAVTPGKLSAAVYSKNGGTAAITTGQSYPVTITGSSRPVIIVVHMDVFNSVTASNAAFLLLYKNGIFLQNLRFFTATTQDFINSIVITDTTGASGSVTYDLRMGAGTLTPAGGSSTSIYLTAYQI